MHRSDRNIGRLILGEQERLVVAGYLSGAGYHDPVLGTVVVHLQREAGARFTQMRLTRKRPPMSTESYQPGGGTRRSGSWSRCAHGRRAC